MVPTGGTDDASEFQGLCLVHEIQICSLSPPSSVSCDSLLGAVAIRTAGEISNGFRLGEKNFRNRVLA